MIDAGASGWYYKNGIAPGTKVYADKNRSTLSRGGKMSKKIFAVLAAALFLGFSAGAYAASDELLDGMVQRLWRGVVNTLTGWVELPAQIVKGYNEGFMGDEDNKIAGTIAGIFDGIGHSAGRTLSGMVDLAGFWAASPEDNKDVGIPLDAEYAWEEGDPYDIMDPDLMDGAVMPIGKKLGRGVGNAVFGFAELPGQVAKGISEGASDLGIIKGLWYWYSREVNGVGDIVTFLVPGPEETKGLAFDEKWPWSALGDELQ